MSNAKEITCPECKRVWPAIAEQGVVTEMYNICYACLIEKVVAARDELQEGADYTVENCPTCNGIPNARATCVTCSHRGWVTSDKPSVPQRQEYKH